MTSVNKAIILGKLGKDPELRYTPSGAAICNLSIATSEKRKDQQGNTIENTEWHRVQVWNKLAENCAKYLAKGRSVYIEGKIQTRSWEQNGQKRYSTEIVAQAVQFIGGSSSQSKQKTQNQVNNFTPPLKDPEPDPLPTNMGGYDLTDIPF